MKILVKKFPLQEHTLQHYMKERGILTGNEYSELDRLAEEYRAKVKAILEKKPVDAFSTRGHPGAPWGRNNF